MLPIIVIKVPVLKTTDELFFTFTLSSTSSKTIKNVCKKESLLKTKGVWVTQWLLHVLHVIIKKILIKAIFTRNPLLDTKGG